MSVLHTGGQDSLSDPTDVELLLEALPPGILQYRQHYIDYAHLDFGLGQDAGARLYPQVLHVLQQHVRHYRE